MPSVKLGLRTADQAQCPEGKSQEFFRDKTLPGFVLVVTPTGKKRFAYQYRVNSKGSMRQIAIGGYPPLHPDAARQIAMEYARTVASGADPQIEKAEARRATEAAIMRKRGLAFNAQWAVYLRWLELGHPKGPRSARYIENATSFGRKYLLPHFGDKPIDQIARSDVAALMEAVPDAFVAVRKNLFTCLRAFLNWAASEAIIDQNPIVAMRGPPAVPSRDRYLSDDEVAQLWNALAALPSPKAAFIRTLLLTGARRNIAKLDWAMLDRSKASATIAAASTKNRKSNFVLFLSSQMIALLDGLAGGERWPTSGPVFTLNGRAPISKFGRLKTDVDAATGKMEHWRLHDLRRTFATHSQAIGVPLHITELNLHHLSGSFGGIVGVYQVYSHESERRAAYQALADHFETIAKRAQNA